MAEQGIAVLFRCDPEKRGDVTYDVFREGEHDLDPVRYAELLRDSCEADFPGSIWSIGMNERARELMRDRRLAEWGMA